MLKIEKTLHQIWCGSPMPTRLQILGDTWKRHHPEWTYKLWGHEEMEALVATSFPDLEEFYHSLPFDIQ